MNIQRLLQKINDRRLMEEISLIDSDIPVLNEAKKSKYTPASADTKGKLHELLVGYHLRGGSHMSMHPGKEGESPKQAHDRLRTSVHPKEYKKIYKRAKRAAQHIFHTHVKEHGDVFDVHWTSQPGDIYRSTGIHSTQTEDASDIMIHSRKGTKVSHHGVSLKVSDSGSPHIPVANPGLKSTYGGEKIHASHRKRIGKMFPQLRGKSISEQRKIVKANPKLHAKLKIENSKTLKRVTSHLHKKLSGMSGKELSQHVRKHVLAAEQTPLQRMGHHHIRHVTYFKGGKQQHHSYNPHTQWDHMLKDHKNLSVKKGGTSVHFMHKGKVFASHRMKFTSQSNPQSGIKGSCNTAGCMLSHQSTHTPRKKKAIRAVAKIRKKRKSKK